MESVVAAACLALGLAASTAQACVTMRMLPAGYADMSVDQIERHFLAQDVAQAAVVAEITVLGFRMTSGYVLYDTAPGRVWKQDSRGPLTELFVDRRHSLVCDRTPDLLEVGKTYVLFAHRAGDLIASVGHRTRSPLIVYSYEEIRVPQEVAAPLSEALVIPVRLLTAR